LSFGWNRLPIRAQSGITVFIPIVAVLISFSFAMYGNLNRAARQDDIQRKFRAVRQYGDLLTLIMIFIRNRPNQFRREGLFIRFGRGKII